MPTLVVGMPRNNRRQDMPTTSVGMAPDHPKIRRYGRLLRSASEGDPAVDHTLGEKLTAQKIPSAWASGWYSYWRGGNYSRVNR